MTADGGEGASDKSNPAGPDGADEQGPFQVPGQGGASKKAPQTEGRHGTSECATEYDSGPADDSAKRPGPTGGNEQVDTHQHELPRQRGLPLQRRQHKTTSPTSSTPSYGAPTSNHRASDGGGERGGEGAGEAPQANRTSPSTSPSSPGARLLDANGTTSPDSARLPDTDLVVCMREGDTGAYDELYRRHAPAVRRYARTCCRDADTAEDLTNEVFAGALQAVRSGKGPESAVRAYLLTSVRHVAAAWTKTQRREQLVEDFAVFAQAAAASSAAEDEPADQGADVRAMRDAERTLVVRAFRSLSEKDQMVLWHTTVEEAKPRDVAPLLGLSDNATAVAAHRARENLKKAYLQAHVSQSLTSGDACSRYADRLGAYARGGLRTRAAIGVRRHLAECTRCGEAAAELASLNQTIRTLVPVAVVGWFATTGGAKVFGALLAGTGATAAAGSASAAGGAGAGGTAGGAAGGTASEGVGLPAKVGLGAAVAAVAGLAVAFALAGGDETPEQPKARPPATHKTSPPPRKPTPEPKPGPERKHSATPSAPAKPSSPTTPHRPVPSRPTPSGSEPAPEPTPTPTHTHPAPKPPPPADYRLDRLRWGVFSGGREGVREPTVRLPESAWLWRRRGLRIGGRTYAYGVTTHSQSSVTVDLHRECRSYDAFAGVDDLTHGAGAVRFSVYGSGNATGRGERLWSSRLVHGGERPVRVQVPLHGVRTIRLVVRPASAAGSWGLADWAQSTISCR